MTEAESVNHNMKETQSFADTAATPWQRVFSRFAEASGKDVWNESMRGLQCDQYYSQSEFADELGVDKSKISRVLHDDKGLISGPDQERIMQAARDKGVEVSPSDLTPRA
jgi:hypothetical protein